MVNSLWNLKQNYRTRGEKWTYVLSITIDNKSMYFSNLCIMILFEGDVNFFIKNKINIMIKFGFFSTQNALYQFGHTATRFINSCGFLLICIRQKTFLLI